MKGVRTKERDAKDARRASKAQWKNSAAGAYLARTAAEGTAAFFAGMTRARYELQPWRPAVLRMWAPHGTVLEIGSRASTDHSILRETADFSIAIDLAPHGACLTDARIRLEGGRGQALLADGEDLPLTSTSIDAVYSFGVIYHTDYPEPIVAEIAGVLRPGGSVLVAVDRWYSLFAISEAGCILEYRQRQLGSRFSAGSVPVRVKGTEDGWPHLIDGITRELRGPCSSDTSFDPQS